jgi:hypothetical protein
MPLLNNVLASQDVPPPRKPDRAPPATGLSQAGRPGPFVINLASAPHRIRKPLQDQLPSDGLHLYQIVRDRDGQQLFQLRLGMIESELEVDALLEMVRDRYPHAARESADDYDFAAARALGRAGEPRWLPSVRTTPPRLPMPVQQDARRSVSAGQKTATAPTDELRLLAEPTAPTPRDIPTLRPAPIQPDRATDARKISAAPPAARLSSVAQPAAPLNRSPRPTPSVNVKPSVAPLDSTQTLRALTRLELADSESSCWFSIQLVLSELPISAEQVPALPIFSEYRLYAVTGLQSNRLMHALRVGFFSSEVAAEAVARFLAHHFDSPSVIRVSIAERERFAHATVKPCRDVGATESHAAIELTAPAPLQQAPPAPQSAGAAAGGGKRVESPQRSGWSRLFTLRVW